MNYVVFFIPAGHYTDGAPVQYASEKLSMYMRIKAATKAEAKKRAQKFAAEEWDKLNASPQRHAVVNIFVEELTKKKARAIYDAFCRRNDWLEHDWMCTLADIAYNFKVDTGF